MTDAATFEQDVRQLHGELLAAWNRRSAREMASLLVDDVTMVGFDGSQMQGRDEVERTLSAIFSDHPTGRYVSKVKAVRLLAPGVALLTAMAGLVPSGQTDLNLEVNAVQSLVAVQEPGRWLVALFQNTPAAFHGRPELSQRLTDELREVLRGS